MKIIFLPNKKNNIFFIWFASWFLDVRLKLMETEHLLTFGETNIEVARCTQ